ncbi:MAG: glucose 1-dehydrogenase [Kofleriaceae bacterium]|nr:glucose 1-dehydrogenase [Myxococcales bacterium]MCB9562538.1 glucose 1-dehydrogenase [Kofleriaceae bacterium]
MSARMSGKRALVTGASSGLGRAIAIRFAAEGARVVLTGRRADPLAEAHAAIVAAGGDATTAIADHTVEADNARCVDEAIAALGGLDVLVNAAGVIGYDGVVAPRPDELRRLMDANFFAVYDLTTRAVPHLIAGAGASILNVSSVAGTRPYAGMLGYCVSKAAIDMFTQSIALELAPQGVRVNAINPGVVVTELHRRAGLDETAYAAFLQRCQDTHPLGRAGTADEVAALATFLCSDEAGWITGDRVAIDGGRALTSLR